MKNRIKKQLKKLPVVKNIYGKHDALLQQIRALQEENTSLANEMIRLRLKQKKQEHEPINVVFVCHRPAIWESLHSVYDYMKQDPDIRTHIVAIPNKKQLPELNLNHEQYESEGAEAFWKSENCIQGYNYSTLEWFDLKTLEPDYVFFQTPYNVCRPPQYHSSVVSKYARICYVSYFGVFYTDEIYDECAPLDYLSDLSFFFTQNPMDDAYIKERFGRIQSHRCQVINTGYPRYDRIEDYRAQPCEMWKEADTFKMVWTPRWTTNEGNCHFFHYKDKIVDYCKNDPGVELVFRPHPQAFKEWNATGELPEKEAESYKRNFVDSNMHLDDTNNYYPTLYASDCLITDRSTILLDYFCTGKPIIYCMSHNVHDKIFPSLMEGMYCVDTWDEVVKVLTGLRQGVDPLKAVRDRIVLENFIYQDDPAGRKIAKLIKKDAQK